MNHGRYALSGVAATTRFVELSVLREQQEVPEAVLQLESSWTFHCAFVGPTVNRGNPQLLPLQRDLHDFGVRPAIISSSSSTKSCTS